MSNGQLAAVARVTSGRPAGGSVEPGQEAQVAQQPGPQPARLTAQDRREQLIGIGVRLLVTTPIHELSVDAVASEAGISRSLLFHYFPSKRDFYAAVIRAASHRLLRAARPAPNTPARLRLTAMIDGLVGFIERHRERYVSLVRAAAGGDAWVLEIHEDTREAMVDRVLAALADRDGAPPAEGPLLRMTVRAWLAYAEELILLWTAAGGTSGADRQTVVTMIEQALDRLVAVGRVGAVSAPQGAPSAP